MANTLPRYDDFKAFIADTYPEMAERIAVSNKATAKHFALVEQEIREQIPSHILLSVSNEDFSQSLELHKIHLDCARSRGPDLNRLLCFTSMQADSDFKDHFQYILMPENRMTPRAYLKRIGFLEDFSLRMKFNDQALNGPALRWFGFFHELCHGLIRFGLHPSESENKHENEVERAFFNARDESICDAFATLNTLQLLGLSAVPAMKAYADMRLSKFQVFGPRYFTALAMEDVLGQVDENGIDWLRCHDRDELYDIAHKAAIDHYVSKEDFDSCYPTVKKQDLFEIDLFGRQQLLNLYRYLLIFGVRKDNEPGSYGRRIQDTYFRSTNVIETQYTHKTVFHGMADDFRRFCKGLRP